jgi:TnpA family transposase
MKHKWTLDELIDHWTLLPNDLELVNRRRTDSNRLGFAIVLKYFQIEGRFPRRRREVPQAVIEYVAKQLQVTPQLYHQYDWRGRSIKTHRATIRSHLGFREGTVADAEAVIEWLCIEVLPHESKAESVVETIYQRYRTLKIEPPTASRIDRLVRSAQRQYSEQFCQQIAARLPAETKRQLDALLNLDVEKEEELAFRSSFGQLKTDAGAISLKSILAEVEKLKRIRQAALPPHLFDDVPLRVVKLYWERVTGEKPREVRRHAPDLRYTLLAAFCWLRQREITDNLVDLFIGIVKRIGSNAENNVDRKLLRDMKRVRGKGRILYNIAKASTAHPDGIVSQVIYPVANEDLLGHIVHEFQTVGSYDDQLLMAARNSYARHYRRMVPALLEVLQFRSNNVQNKALMKALEIIRQYTDSDRKYYLVDDEVPLDDIVPVQWRGLVLRRKSRGTERVNRISYEVCVFQVLREQLRCRAIWVEGAYRYRNPNEDLPSDFSERRPVYYEALQQPLDAATFISRIRQEMVDALSMLDEGLPANRWLAIVANSKRRIRLSPLPAQPKPVNLYYLKRLVQEQWPMTPLLDMLKETDMRVRFTDKFQTTATREYLDSDTLQKRLPLCLYALGTNTGFKRIGHEETVDALQHIRRRYVNKLNLRAAIAEVVNAIFHVRHTHIWGEATTACASDAKKFAAWDQNLLTEWHVRYRGPGIMVYWHIDKKAACIHSQVKRCSSSEVAAMIEGVLHHCTEMSVEKNYVDSHGQSEVAFAFCHLLGFRLLPRLKPISKQRLYRPFKIEAGTFANLQPILTRPIRWKLIEQHYDEMMKYATALRLGTVEAEAILRRFTRGGVQHPTYKALAELGKAIKTIFLCESLHSLDLRREIHEGLNVIETWNSANSFIFYGRGSEIATNNRQAQEISVLAMHLLQVSMVYINTLMIQQVLAQPEWHSRMAPEDLRALSPLIYSHVNPYGRFDLNMSERLALEG